MGFRKGTLEGYHLKEDFFDVDLGCVDERLEAHIVVISLRGYHGICSSGIGVRYGGGG